MGSVLSDTSPYLYPFIVEYSLIGAAFLYVMWTNIGRVGVGARGNLPDGSSSPVSSPSSPTGLTIDNMSTTSSRDSNTFSTHSLYSCLGSSKGGT